MKAVFSLIAILFVAGCKNSFYTERDFPSLQKVDAHVHISTHNGYFEGQARADNFILFTINVDAYDSAAVEKQYQAAAESARRNPGRVFYAATFHFDTTGWGSERWSRNVIDNLQRHFSGNPLSVKIWKNVGMTVRDKKGKFIMVDDPGLDPVIDFIMSKRLAVTGHLGEPKNCWLPLEKMTVSGDSSYFAEHPQYHMYLHPEYPSYEDQINARDHFLERHPNLIFIGCHLGSLEWNVDELAKRLDKFPNMAVDMSARICHLQYQAMTNNKKVRDFCIKYQDRLLYGTDMSDLDSGDSLSLKNRMHETWTSDWKFFVTGDRMRSNNFRGDFYGLYLPKEVVDKIFFKNAVRWYRMKT